MAVWVQNGYKYIDCLSLWLWLTGSWGSLPAAQHHESVCLAREKIKIQSSVSTEWLLSHIMKLKNLKSNHHKSGTVCDRLCKSGLLCGVITCETHIEYQAPGSPGPTVVLHVLVWGLPSPRSWPWDEDSRTHGVFRGWPQEVPTRDGDLRQGGKDPCSGCQWAGDKVGTWGLVQLWTLGRQHKSLCLKVVPPRVREEFIFPSIIGLGMLPGVLVRSGKCAGC